MMRIQISLSFRRGSYGEIGEFCQNVISRTDGVTAYNELQVQVDIVKPLLTKYESAVVAAMDGGKLLTQAKRKAKVNLLDAMEDLAALTKVYAKGVATYVTDAGFQLKKRAVRSNQPLPQPEWNFLKRGVLSGTVEGEIKNFPAGVKEVGIKHSYDGWATEKNGTYSTGKKFVLAGLEVKREVEVKICYLGTYQRKSDDSLPMQVFVL
jgi:hypothetical protein